MLTVSMKQLAIIAELFRFFGICAKLTIVIMLNLCCMYVICFSCMMTYLEPASITTSYTLKALIKSFQLICNIHHHLHKVSPYKAILMVNIALHEKNGIFSWPKLIRTQSAHLTYQSKALNEGSIGEEIVKSIISCKSLCPINCFSNAMLSLVLCAICNKSPSLFKKIIRIKDIAKTLVALKISFSKYSRYGLVEVFLWWIVYNQGMNLPYHIKQQQMK